MAGGAERWGIFLGDKLTDAIAEKVAPILLDLGYELADLELVKEGANWHLRFFIEHVAHHNPVGIDDCQRASEAISDWLDEADPIPQSYFLEVSSPGIERRLSKEKDFIRFQNHMVRVDTCKPVEGSKTHLGLLGAVTDTALILKQERQEITFCRDWISGVHLFWDEYKEG